MLNGRLVISCVTAIGLLAGLAVGTFRILGSAPAESEILSAPDEGEVRYVEIFQDLAEAADDLIGLVDESDVILVGRIVRTDAFQSPEGIAVTRALVAPERLIFARSGRGSVDVFVMEQFGGIVDGVTYTNAENPIYHTGDLEVLFLSDRGTLDGSHNLQPAFGFQGRFVIREGFVYPVDRAVFASYRKWTVDRFIDEVERLVPHGAL